MGIIKDMKVDYGFDDTGATSNTTKYFTLAKPDMVGQTSVVHNYNSGSYKFTGFGGSFGVPNCGDLTVNLGTATLHDGGSGGSGGSGEGPPYTSAHEGQIGIDPTLGNVGGFIDPGGKSARIQTCYPGSTSVTLTTASAAAGHISRFSVGQYMMVAGWALQGSFISGYSYPNNFQWHDFVKITSIVGNTIFFANQPLTYYYDQNWPEMNRGTQFEIDAAGPASIFALSLDWDGSTTINDGTFDISPTTGTFINSSRRIFTANNVVQVGKTFYPSMMMAYVAVNNSVPNVLVEHDKNVDLVDIQGGSFLQWKVQSSSTKLFKLTGVTIGTVNGTGNVAEIANCTVTGNLNVGPTAYGRGDTLRVTNTSIAGSISTYGLLISGTRNRNTTGLRGLISMSNGVITVPLSVGSDLFRIFMPDSRGRNVLWWSTFAGAIAPFKVLSVTSDTWPAVDNQTVVMDVTTTSGGNTMQTPAGNFSAADIGKVIVIPGASGANTTVITGWSTNAGTDTITTWDLNTTTQSAVSGSVQWGTCNFYVQTDQAGGLPNPSLGSQLDIRVPALRSIYFENVTGSDQALDLSQPAARNKPIGSYTLRHHDGQTNYTGVNAPSVFMIGEVQSLKINVLTPYSGASPLTANIVIRRRTGDIQTGSVAFYSSTINLKVAGERVLLPNGVTTGAQTGDTLNNLAANNWSTDTLAVQLSRNITAESSATKPDFTVEMITDQGFSTLPVAVAPLRMRLKV